MNQALTNQIRNTDPDENEADEIQVLDQKPANLKQDFNSIVDPK